MPELPEVEICRDNLARWTVGARVVRVDARDPGRVDGDPRRLEGATFTAWERRGKYLIARLEPDLAVVSHLGMTGKWIRAPGQRRFQRLVLDLDSGARVALVDMRRLGRTWIVAPAELDDHPRLATLGPDPLHDGLTGALLRERVGVGRAPLQARLLEQRRVAGLGNICALEGCFRAGVHPLTRARDVPGAVWPRLAEGLLGHIADTLRVEAGDEIAYLQEGGANPFAVYGKDGAPCPACGTTVARDAHGGRPTFYCPSCQPAS